MNTEKLLDLILNLKEEAISEDTFTEYPDDGLGSNYWDESFEDKQMGMERGIDFIKDLIKYYKRNLPTNNEQELKLLYSLVPESYMTTEALKGNNKYKI